MAASAQVSYHARQSLMKSTSMAARGQVSSHARQSLMKSTSMAASAQVQRWACVPGFAFPCSRAPAFPGSCVPGILGTRRAGTQILYRNAERERIGALN